MGSPFTPLYFSTLELSNLCIHYKSHNVIICALNNQMFYSFTRKMILMKLFAGQQWRHRHREETSGHGSGQGWGEEGEGGMYGESNMETYTSLYVKQIANRDLLYDSGNPNGSSVTT